jgi:putative redox protein
MATVREKTIVQTRLNGDGIGHARTDVSARDLLSTIDEPVERGGTNKGFSPTETALAALIGCTNVIGHKCADKLGVAIGHLKISLVCDFDRRGVTLQEEIDRPFGRIQLKIEADGPATQQQLDTVAREVARFCPVSKLFRAAGTNIEEEWVAAHTA